MDEGCASANPSFMDHFSCKICLEMLDKPKQCQINEHYFCDSCIKQHLARSSTCPVCRDELTLETLRAPSRVIVEILSKLTKPKCKYTERGCKEDVSVEDLLSHHEVCDFAPMKCRYEGCAETVNKRDLASHESESCKLRKTTCDQCREEMTFVAYEMHPCFMRSDVDGMQVQMNGMRVQMEEMNLQMERLKRNVTEKWNELSNEMKASMKTLNQAVKELQDPLRNANVSQSSQIFVAGGISNKSQKSYEIFNWSTKTWSLYENVFFFDHCGSFCFPYKNSIMVCSAKLGKMEYVDIKNDPHRATAFPGSIIKNSHYASKGVVCEDKVFTFYDNAVNVTNLCTPGSPQTILQIGKRSNYGVECFDRKIVFGGGEILNGRSMITTDTVEQYDVTNNTNESLATLPYPVTSMATVRYKDNIIFIGGQGSSGKPLNSAFMYNVTTQESKKLPSMLESRYACAAVMMGKVIVVMGGSVGRTNSNTAEYHVLGQPGWNKLPDMHLARHGATASVLI